MNADIELLERVVNYLTRVANKCAANAALDNHHGNMEDALKQERQRADLLKGADAVRSAIRSLKRKVRANEFIPPTAEEVIAFAESHEDIKGKWPKADIKSWWNFFQSNGWLVSGKTKMRDWKAAALNGFKRWVEKNPGRAKGKPSDSDPRGWVEYLKKIGRAWVAYRYAPDHLRSDFHKGSD